MRNTVSLHSRVIVLRVDIMALKSLSSSVVLCPIGVLKLALF